MADLRFAPVRRDPARPMTGPPAWTAPPRRLLPLAVGPRMRVLAVLSSSNQMYSGIGRAVFELAARLRERVDFEFAIDDLDSRNRDLVRDFGRDHAIPVHVGPGVMSPRSLDTTSSTLPALLAEDRWDVVEAVCWANSATNAAVLGAIGDRALVYTPHFQPTWTVPMPPEVAAHTDEVHRGMVRRADSVLCVSPWERQVVQAHAPGRNNVHYLPNGCNLAEYRPGGGDRKPHLLFVGDLAEPRKRFDRVLAIFPHLRQQWPDLKLVVIGNGSAAAWDRIPPGLRDACDLRGYVAERDLRRAYAESRGVFLLSDFEAFGLPILEGLAAGAPVFLTDLPVTRSLFGTYRGAHFCPADDPAATLAIVAATLSRGEAESIEIRRDRDRLAASFDWDILAVQKWHALAAAWFTRHYLDRPFQGPRPRPDFTLASRS